MANFETYSPFLQRVKNYHLLHILIAITVLYLFWQISLSGAILTANNPEKTRTLSDIARYTVGFGMFLFVFRTCCGKFFYSLTVAQSLKKYLFWLIMLFSVLAGWGAMAAEDAIVNHYADRTSGQDRLDAKLILFFNQAFDTGKVSLPDLSSSIADNKIGSRTFAKMLGFAIWTNPALIKQIKSQAALILTAIHGQQWYDKIDNSYDEYINNFKKFSNEFGSFDILERRNFSRDSSMLNQQLAKFAKCSTEECRDKITDQTKHYIKNNIGNFPIELTEFCKKIPVERYVMGKKISDKESLECSVTETELYQWILGKKKEFINKSFEKSGLQEDMLANLDFQKPVSREVWRERFLKNMEKEIKQIERKEFAQPENYGAGGTEEIKGRDYSIAIFLPPIALGFSVTVCFLHLASLVARFTRFSLISYIAAFVIWLSPFFFATAIPLSGFWGEYGRWLIFWEETLYPFGILRWLLA